MPNVKINSNNFFQANFTESFLPLYFLELKKIGRLVKGKKMSTFNKMFNSLDNGLEQDSYI